MRFDLGRGGVVLLELADVENVMHFCAAGGQEGPVERRCTRYV